MKNVFTLLLVCIWSNQSGFAQKPETELLNFIQTELNIGNNTFQMMTNQAIPSKVEKHLLIDGKGKILYTKFDNRERGNAPIMQFKTSDSIKLKIEYKDSLLIIRPIENSFCPLITINLKSTSVSINDYTLENVKQLSIKNKTNVFKSEWNGFRWWSDLSNKSLTIKPSFTIGKIKENGNIYLEIIWDEKGKKMHYRLLS
jgi:hypothetical protein